MAENVTCCFHTPFKARSLLLVVLVGLTLVPGCGPRSDRLPINGKITLDGTPVDTGSIRFTSAGGEKLFTSGAMIMNGEYQIPKDKGLPPGTYRVEINAPDTKAPPVATRPAPGEPLGPPTAPERIPPEYNSATKQTVEVASNKDNFFEFNIVTRK